MTLSIYLTFEDNCREAFEFYRSVFGGEFDNVQTFGDGPPDMGVPEEARGRIMHMSLPVGGSVLMGSDSGAGSGGGPVVGANFSIHYAASSREDADAVYGKLSHGGDASMPMGEMFWGAYFGSCTDRFGIGWQVGHDPPSEA